MNANSTWDQTIDVHHDWSVDLSVGGWIISHSIHGSIQNRSIKLPFVLFDWDNSKMTTNRNSNHMNNIPFSDLQNPLFSHPSDEPSSLTYIWSRKVVRSKKLLNLACICGNRSLSRENAYVCARSTFKANSCMIRWRPNIIGDI